MSGTAGRNVLERLAQQTKQDAGQSPDLPDGEPAPDAAPVGAFAFLASPDGYVQAWIVPGPDGPVGYFRSAFDPASTVALADTTAWQAAVDERSMVEQPVPTAALDDDTDPGDPDDQSPDPGPDAEAEAGTGDDTEASGQPEGKAAAPAFPRGQQAAARGKDTPAEDDEDEHTGIMVALMVPGGDAADLAIDHPQATPADDMHITLLYLGTTDTIDDEAKFIADALDVIRDIAATHKPVAGTINGIGRFNTPDGDAYHLTYDSPDLPPLRQHLFDAMTDAGIDPVNNHGFSPHITLAYLQPGEDMPARRGPDSAMEFTEITLAYGETRIVAKLGERIADDQQELLEAELGIRPDSTAPSLREREGKDGKRFGAPKRKGAPPQIANGSWVSLSGGRVGRVDLVVTNGSVPGVDGDVEGTAASPAARVVLYEKTGTGARSTGRKVGAKVQTLKRIPPPTKTGKKSAPEHLTSMLHAHQIGVSIDPALLSVGSATLTTVYGRGVKSAPAGANAEAWGLGRARAFLRMVAGGGVPDGYAGDRDLLPPGHPLRPAAVAGVSVKRLDPVDLSDLPSPADLVAGLREAAGTARP